MILDPGRRETDERLAKIEKKLHEIYSQSYSELKEKADNYFEKFRKADLEKAKLVKAGQLSEEEYRNWRRTQMLRGKHWNTLKEQSASYIHNVNKIATAYVNDQLPDIYTLNYNLSARDIENTVDKISFEMVDARTVKNLSLADGKSFLPYKKLDPRKDIPWNMRKINNEMLQGVLQGESIPEIAQRFINVGVANEVSAVRAARTMMTTVENSARLDSAKRAQENGVILGKIWLSVSDSRTRDWHKQAAYDYADPIPIDDPFIVNGEEMDAPGDTRASGSNVYNCRCSLGRRVLGFKSILPQDKQGKIKVVFEDE